MRNKVVEIQDLSFAYDHVKILDHLSCAVYEREFVAVVGENGAGKSTMLNLMLGNLKSNQGSIHLYGKNIRKNNCYERIAYISQNAVMNYRNFPTTIEEVVKVHLRYLKKKTDVKKYLELVKLEAHAKKTLRELSGGQLQRVGLLLALIKEADLIILDEPTAGIDKKFSLGLVHLLKEMSAAGKTIVMVTHYLAEVHGFVDRVLKLENGRITDCGTKEAA